MTKIEKNLKTLLEKYKILEEFYCTLQFPILGNDVSIFLLRTISSTILQPLTQLPFAKLRINFVNSIFKSRKTSKKVQKHLRYLK